LRTARTLTNTQLWQQVHRVGGYASVAFGALVAIAGLMAPMRDTVAGLISLAGVVAAMAVFLTYRRYARA
jgi:SdpI/YfhL protein family